MACGIALVLLAKEVSSYAMNCMDVLVLLYGVYVVLVPLLSYWQSSLAFHYLRSHVAGSEVCIFSEICLSMCSLPIV